MKVILSVTFLEEVEQQQQLQKDLIDVGLQQI